MEDGRQRVSGEDDNQSMWRRDMVEYVEERKMWKRDLSGRMSYIKGKRNRIWKNENQENKWKRRETKYEGKREKKHVCYFRNVFPFCLVFCPPLLNVNKNRHERNEGTRRQEPSTQCEAGRDSRPARPFVRLAQIRGRKKIPKLAEQ